VINTTDRFRAIIKLFFFFLLLVGSIIALYIRLLFTSKQRHQLTKFHARKKFCQRTNTIFGIQIITIGDPPPSGTYLYVSNHRSFYDPIAFLSQWVANPVSKAEVSRYPLIGWGARLTEVLMLHRNNRKERGLMKLKITENLYHGTSILLYPEGTTTDHPLTAQFQRGGFTAAVEAGRKIVPVAMEYAHAGLYWIDQPLFTQFVYQVTGPVGRRTIYMSIGNPLWDDDPNKLLIAVQDSINGQFDILRRSRHTQSMIGMQEKKRG